MTTKQLQHHIAYMKIAENIGNLSYCKRKQVGSVLVKDNNIISTGYNGTPKGMPNVCEDNDGETNWYTLHSEANAITKLAKSTQSSDGSILYLTLSPCKDCAKLILQARIKEIYYGNKHSCNEGIAFLSIQGVKCYYLKKEIKNVIEEGGTGSANYVINTYEKYTCEFFNPLNKSHKDIHDNDWELINSISDTSILNLHHTNEIINVNQNDLIFQDNSEKLSQIINAQKLFVPKIFGQDFLNKLFTKFDNIYDIILIEDEEYSNGVLDNQNNLFIKGEEGRYHFKNEYKKINNFIKSIFNNEPELVVNNYLYLDSHDNIKDYVAKIPSRLLSTVEEATIGINKIEAAGIYGKLDKPFEFKEKETILIHDILPCELNFHIKNTLGLKYNIRFTNNEVDYNDENQLFTYIDNFLHFNTNKTYINFKLSSKFNEVVLLIVKWFDTKNNKFDDIELSYLIKPVEMQKTEKIFYLLTTKKIGLIKGNRSKSLILIHDILPESLIKSLKKKYDKNGCYKIEVTKNDLLLNDDSQLFTAEIKLEGNRKIFKFHIKNSIYFQEIKKDIVNFYGFHQNIYNGYELKKIHEENNKFKYYLEYERLLTIDELNDLAVIKNPNKSLLDEIKLEDTNNYPYIMPSYFIPNQFGILEKNPFYNNGLTNDNYYKARHTSSNYPFNYNSFPNIVTNNQIIKNTLVEQKIAICIYTLPINLRENLTIIFGNIFHFYENDCIKTKELEQVKNSNYFYFITLNRMENDYVIYDFNIPNDINNSNKNLIEIRNYIIEYFRDNKCYELFIENNTPKLKVTPITGI